MAKLVNLTVNCRPSALMRRMLLHSGDVSEGTQHKILAHRQILKRHVTFYCNGLRVIKGMDLNEEEVHDSEILRLAHASLLIGAPVGDKRFCYVDATVNPVIIWIYGMAIKEFLATSQCLVETQQLGIEPLLEEPIRKTVEKTNERNVRLFGRQPCGAHLSHDLLVEADSSSDCSADH